jgi:uncharacterized DUF497 family protein
VGELCYLLSEGVSVKFEWDAKKAASNLSKHGVAFEEALTVFADPLARMFDTRTTRPRNNARSSSVTL